MSENQNFQEQIPASEVPSEKFPGMEELKEKVSNIETELGPENIPEKKQEIIKEEIKSHIKELQQSSALSVPLKSRDESKEIKQFAPQQQIEALVSLVFEKGLQDAVDVAKNLDNPAILDSFHDALVDKYYQKLIQENIIKS